VYLICAPGCYKGALWRCNVHINRAMLVPGQNNTRPSQRDAHADPGPPLREELGGIGALSAWLHVTPLSAPRGCRSHYGAVLLAFDRAADRLTSQNLLHWRLLPDTCQLKEIGDVGRSEPWSCSALDD
jgi:hypothetical protein